MVRFLALSTLVMAGMLGALAQGTTVTVSPPQRTITVSGTAQVQATPTLALVVVAVQTQAETVAAAVEANNTAASRVVQAINNLRINRLTVRTIDFNVQPIYEQRPPTAPPSTTPPRIVGYQVINRLEARIPGATSTALSSAVSRVIEAALNAGANRVDSIQFTLEDMTAAQNQALAQAINNARSTARAAAAAAGVQIAALHSLTTQPAYPPMPYLARAEMAVSGPPIVAGELTVQSSVTLVYTIR